MVLQVFKNGTVKAFLLRLSYHLAKVDNQVDTRACRLPAITFYKDPVHFYCTVSDNAHRLEEANDRRCHMLYTVKLAEVDL